MVIALLAVSVVSFLTLTCRSGGGNYLFLVDNLYAVADSIEDDRKIDLPRGGRADIEVVRDLGNPVPEMRKALEGRYSRVLVSPYLFEAAESLASEYPETFFGLMRYGAPEAGEGGGNTASLVLDRSEAVTALAGRIAAEVDPGGGGTHILGVWRAVSAEDREELELFREALSADSGGRFSVEIRPVGEAPDFGELEIFIREELTADTVLGLCFAGPVNVSCARVFWEYGIPVASEGLPSPEHVWGPVAFTVFHDPRAVFEEFLSLDAAENLPPAVIGASIAPSGGSGS